MTRKELYEQIVSLGLKSEIQKRFNKNYTNCSTAQLTEIVSNAINLKKTETSHTSNNSNVKECLKTLIKNLRKKHIILECEMNDLLGML